MAAKIFNSVTNLPMKELLLPHIRGEISEESSAFMETLLSTDPGLIEEVMEYDSSHDLLRQDQDESKGLVLDLLRHLFQPQYKESVILPVAVRLGMFPGEFSGSAYDMNVHGEKHVRGTWPRVPQPVDAPESKMEALFDLRPCFDALRLSFVVYADPARSI